MRRLFTATACVLTLPIAAHFGMLLPEADHIDPGQRGDIPLLVGFGHPADGELLGGEAPVACGVVIEGEHHDLSDALEVHTDDEGRNWWSLNYQISEPGDHVFYSNPSPYWEPAEDIFIAHHVKTVVTVGDGGEGWAKALGPERSVVELIPLTRPNGFYAGNTLRAQVLYQGQPVAGAMVEVERCHWRNLSPGTLKPPTPLHETQELMTDEHGILAFSPPVAGWWGIAALVEDEHQEAIAGEALSIEHPEHGAKAVELGAVLWFYAHDAQLQPHDE